MNWLGPLDGKTWLDEPTVSPERKGRRIGRRQRTVGGERSYLEERIAKAEELAKVYTRSKVAKIMKVDPSTVTKWLGAKYLEKRRWDYRDKQK